MNVKFHNIVLEIKESRDQLKTLLQKNNISFMNCFNGQQRHKMTFQDFSIHHFSWLIIFCTHFTLSFKLTSKKLNTEKMSCDSLKPEIIKCALRREETAHHKRKSHHCFISEKQTKKSSTIFTYSRKLFYSFIVKEPNYVR